MQRNFDIEKPFIAREPFVYAGTSLGRGDTFDWQGLGCDERRLQQMWDQRIVECGELPASLRPVAPAAGELTDAELEAATAPATDPRKRVGKR